MAKKKKGAKRPQPRRTARRKTFVPLKRSERKQITEFSRYIPTLEHLKGKERITSAKYGAFKRAKKKLRHLENLRPVTEKQAKLLKGKLAGNGIRAVRLRNTADNAKVSIRKGGIIVTSNGRDFEYHPVRPTPEALIDAGSKQFDRKEVQQIFLWLNKGRGDEGAGSKEKWAQLVAYWFERGNSAQAFKKHGKDFIYGIAVLVGGKKATKK